MAWLGLSGEVDHHVFPGRVDPNGRLSTRRYARLVDEWVTGGGLMRSDDGTHSLRRTKASIIYDATDNLRGIRILLGHSKIENRVRYIGIDVEDALTLVENTEIRPMALRLRRGATSRSLGHRVINLATLLEGTKSR